MFDNLSARLSTVFFGLRGRGRLTEDNIKSALREIRMALLEADVAVSVTKSFIEDVRERAVGKEVSGSLTPDQALIKIVHEELVNTLGKETVELDLRTRPPAVILLVGLQGAGKTTTAAKLAKFISEQKKKSVLLTSVDVYRPAAIQQLEILAKQVGQDFHASQSGIVPAAILQSAIATAKKTGTEVVIADTAGRLHVNAEMMEEVAELHAIGKPAETLFVVDAMTGQDAANAARVFADKLPLTGIVLTKLDGDARGGAALSARALTGAPIKFIGTGEKLEQLEIFHPDRIADRVLGKGDVRTLIEDVERKADRVQAERMAKKLKKGRGLDLNDLAGQLEKLMGMGGLAAMLDKLPGLRQLPPGAQGMADDHSLKSQLAMIRSMTPQERCRPEILNGSRKRRIAGGSGTTVQNLNRLLKQFTQMNKMMRKISKGGHNKLLRGLQSRLPPGAKGF
ncbi:MAG: signal recognition particle protein [Gammaproteobacteria bacterium]